VVGAWQQRGIDSILLKGPTTAEWLYRHEARGYQDADLLVSPGRLADAEEVLRELGFAAAPEPDSEHAHPWLRSSDRSVIDLHKTVWGPTRPPAQVWRELRHWTEPYRIGPVTMHGLGIPARALHIALHAAQHRDVLSRRAELRRALARTTLAQWRQAEQLADRLWALPMMAVGLELEPAGRELLEELPLARAGLRAEVDDAPLAIGFARVAAAQGVRTKASVLVRALLPEEDADASSRRAPMGGLARRMLWVLTGIPRTLRAMYRAR
jgi:hypothetical protein